MPSNWVAFSPASLVSLKHLIWVICICDIGNIRKKGKWLPLGSHENLGRYISFLFTSGQFFPKERLQSVAWTTLSYRAFSGTFRNGKTGQSVDRLFRLPLDAFCRVERPSG